MGASFSCCNRNETIGERPNVQKIVNINAHQKIVELKAYRFFINHLLNLMLINNGVEKQEFYFIRKSWIKSWAKYTSYIQIRPLLIKNEINNEINQVLLNFSKLINLILILKKTFIFSMQKY